MTEIIANQDAQKRVPGFGGRISAALVWDGTDEVRVPEAMGKPRDDQMRGTAREQLVELAGRCCYDSLGKGRSSTDYAKHLLDVGHLSVLEHAAFTVEFHLDDGAWSKVASLFLNRPSLWVRVIPDQVFSVRVTMNLRHVREFGRASARWVVDASILRGTLGRLRPFYWR